jgi:hypothetical protein
MNIHKHVRTTPRSLGQIVVPVLSEREAPADVASSSGGNRASPWRRRSRAIVGAFKSIAMWRRREPIIPASRDVFVYFDVRGRLACGA